MISPRAESAPFDTAKRIFDWAVLGMLCWLILPVGIAVLLAVEAPNYWSPMYSSPIGFVLLGLAVGTIGISVGLVLMARRVAGPSRGQLLAGVGLVMVAFVTQFITLWIVFLGPALVILLTPPQA